MKKIYYSPEVKVEELVSKDVLCDSGEPTRSLSPNGLKRDNFNQVFTTLSDFSQFM